MNGHADWKLVRNAYIGSNIWPVCVATHSAKWFVVTKHIAPDGVIGTSLVPISELNELGDHRDALQELLSFGAQVRNCKLLALALGAWVDFGDPPVFSKGEYVKHPFGM